MNHIFQTSMWLSFFKSWYTGTAEQYAFQIWKPIHIQSESALVKKIN